MNDIHVPNRQTENYPDGWKSWPPEAVLKGLVNELKSPLFSIKGHAQILSMSSDEELRAKATQTIVKITDNIQDLMKEVVEYLNAYDAKLPKE